VSQLQISLVIPAWNEETRILPFLRAIAHRVPIDGSLSLEVLVVDDGSVDGTNLLVRSFAKGIPWLRLLEHKRNEGKGAAIRTGWRESRGHWLAFVDADGAISVDDLFAAFELARFTHQGVFVGTRMRERRPLLRKLAGIAFRFAVRMVLGQLAGDPQCGLKMIDRALYRAIEPELREKGYLFDLELLSLVRQRGISICEFPVTWREVAGSKVRLLRDAVRMLVGLARLRRTRLPITRDKPG
jgi:glycosyltransferase involved in cell wall biosynthesis